MDRFSRTCLLLIVLLLGVIAVRPVLVPQPARAATPSKYLVVFPEREDERLQDALDRYSADGWELVSAVARPPYVGLIFRRDAQ